MITRPCWQHRDTFRSGDVTVTAGDASAPPAGTRLRGRTWRIPVSELSHDDVIVTDPTMDDQVNARGWRLVSYSSGRLTVARVKRSAVGASWVDSGPVKSQQMPAGTPLVVIRNARKETARPYLEGGREASQLQQILATRGDQGRQAELRRIYEEGIKAGQKSTADDPFAIYLDHRTPLDRQVYVDGMKQGWLTRHGTAEVPPIDTPRSWTAYWRLHYASR